MKNTLVTILCFLAMASFSDEFLPEQLSSCQEKAIQYMLSRQDSRNGSWLGVFGQPAITALAAIGIHGSPAFQNDAEIRNRMDAALDYIISCAQPDGSIFQSSRKGNGNDGPTTRILRRGYRHPPSDNNAPASKTGRSQKHGEATGHHTVTVPSHAGSYSVYNTSICLLALATYNCPQDLEIIRKARAYLMGSDAIPNAVENTPQGGFGYGSQTRSDLNNTAWALEALHATDYLDREPFSQNPEQAKKTTLAWNNALQFITACQNLRDTNQSAWITSAPENDKGGFIYCPQDAMKNDAAPEALRAYGSMTYAGLKSLIYAKVKPDDTRILAAQQWIQKYYTLDENPGVGQAGIFYYFHTFAKTLALLGNATVTDASGNEHRWQSELAARLIATQHPDGSWCNEKSGRWMESIPELATAYCLMTIKLVCSKQKP